VLLCEIKKTFYIIDMKYFYLEKKRYKKKGNWIVYFSVFAIFFTGLNAEAQTDDLRYGTGNWNADTLGNHRVVLKVEKEVDAVYAYFYRKLGRRK